MLYRKVIRDSLSGEPEMVVVGTAADGNACLQKIRELQPDVVTLDVEMPVLDGLGVLRALDHDSAAPGIVLISGCSASSASLTATALRLGAFDFIVKPTEDSAGASARVLRERLLPVVKCCAERLQSRKRGANGTVEATSPHPPKPDTLTRLKSFTRALPPKVVGIGTSTGGPNALAEMLPQLPASIPLPILVVQHMPAVFTQSLAEELNRLCQIHVVEAKDGMSLEPGCAYIAPGGRQMKVVNDGGAASVCVNDDPPVGNCRPAVDYLFRSLADVFGDRVLALIMTGMGDDGTDGCRALHNLGATVLAQDKHSSVVFGMPGQIVKEGLADDVRALHALPEAIMSYIESPE